MAKVRVEYARDQRDAWVFRVPALGIVGVGSSREEARRRAFDAIAVTLEITPDEQPADEAEYVDVRLG
jgi:predicted RNase H-like HicB family nuclease